MRQDDGNGGFGEVVVVVGKWLWMWGGGCGGGCWWEGGVGVKRGCDERQCDMGGYGIRVQVMECVKIEGLEREGVRKRVSSHSHIDMK